MTTPNINAPNIDELYADFEKYVPTLNITEFEKQKLLNDIEKVKNSNAVMKPIRMMAIATKIMKITGAK